MWHGEWRHWWFWAALLPVVLVYRYVDRLLTAYCVRYWKARGQEPPARRNAYRTDAASLVTYTVAAVVIAGVLAVDRDFIGAGCFALTAVALGRWALVRARNNVIG